MRTRPTAPKAPTTAQAEAAQAETQVAADAVVARVFDSVGAEDRAAAAAVADAAEEHIRMRGFIGRIRTPSSGHATAAAARRTWQTLATRKPTSMGNPFSIVKKMLHKHC